MTLSRLYKSAAIGILGVAALLATPLAAQTVDVAFKNNTGGLAVSGRLVAISDAAFVVATQAGNVTVIPADVTCTSKACPVTGPQPRQQVPAQMSRIVLSSLDKQIDIEGELQDVTDERWLVAISGLGRVSFERRGLRCSGPPLWSNRSRLLGQVT